MSTYKIVRLFKRDDLRSKTIKTGLTLEQAQRWCSDPDTSSSTCTTKHGKQRTREMGDWFDAYDEEGKYR